MIAANPLRSVRREKETLRWVNLTEMQELQLLKAVSEESPDLLWFVAFALEVPCRRGEMLQAGRECFDSFSNTITLQGSLTKNGRPCTKPVPESLVAYFRTNPSPWLFYRWEGGEYKPLGFVQKRWERAVKAAGLDDLRDQHGSLDRHGRYPWTGHAEILGATSASKWMNMHDTLPKFGSTARKA
jgi:integrase